VAIPLVSQHVTMTRRDWPIRSGRGSATARAMLFMLVRVSACLLAFSMLLVAQVPALGASVHRRSPLRSLDTSTVDCPVLLENAVGCDLFRGGKAHGSPAFQSGQTRQESPDRPPDAGLRAHSGGQKGILRSWCWPSRPGEPSICGDSCCGDSAEDFLPVEEKEMVQFYIALRGGTKPRGVRLEIYKPRVFPPGQPTPPPDSSEFFPQLIDGERLMRSLRPTWRVALPPGEYLVLLVAEWSAKQSAAWRFALAVTLPNTGASDRSRILAILAFASAAALMSVLIFPKHAHSQ
jgi:hypothetical protein